MERHHIPFFLSLFLGILLFNGPVQAQKDSSSCKKGESCCIMDCISSGDFSASTFGGPQGAFTSTGVGGEFAAGGGGGLMFDCGLFVGGFGKGGSSSMRSQEAYHNEEVDLKTGYGGLMIGGHPFKDKLFHPTWSVQLGYGGVEGRIQDYVDGENELTVMEEDIFVIEPDLGVGITLSNSMMLNVSTGYRFVKGFGGDEKLGLASDDLNGFQGEFGIIFGDFK